jgi:CRISPR system Cascade subunit CasA
MKDNLPNPVHPQPDGIGYRLWLGLVESSGDGQRKPAKVIERFRTLREDGRLWAFGYDMDNMKARCWYDATMPLLAVRENAEPLFRAWVERLVQAASLAAYDVRQSVKAALFGGTEVRGDLSFISAHFWSSTEASFYTHIPKLRDLAPTGQGEQSVMESWLSELRNHGFATFDQCTQTGDFDARDPRRIALARNGLAKALTGKKLRQMMGLH